MNFLAPQWLWLLVGVAALAVTYVLIQLRRKRFVARFSNVELLGSVAPRRPGWRRHLTFALLFISLTVLSVGVAQPSAAVQVPRERATVMMAIDVSLSMNATDVLPSRIAAAKSAAAKFTQILPARINLGLVSFGGAASLLVPPTIDRHAVSTAISGLQLENSTAIGEAIFTCLNAIKTFSAATTPTNTAPDPARIVLLSDGANNKGRSVDSAIAAAKAAHVQISTIAFGTEDGTLQLEGQTIAVPPDYQTLQSIATQTGGTYHPAASEQELQSVYSNIGSQIGYTTVHRDISWRYLLAGLLCALAAATSAMLWGGRLV